MARTAIQIAKVSLPRTPEIIPRERLFKLIDKHRARPVIWVSGPPGAGKTSLVSSYIDARELSHLWYQVDEGDADPATFFHYLGLASRGVAGKRGTPLPQFTPEYREGLPAFTRRFFEALFARIRPPFLFVLDNYQEAPEGSAFQEVIALALTAIPD